MSEIKYPFTWEDLPHEDVATIKKHFGLSSVHRDLVRSRPRAFTLKKSILLNYERLFQMKLRPDDIWVVTYPKCGTTWVLEMVLKIMNGVDLETAQKPLFIDFVMIMGKSKAEVDAFFDRIEKVIK